MRLPSGRSSISISGVAKRRRLTESSRNPLPPGEGRVRVCVAARTLPVLAHLQALILTLSRRERGCDRFIKLFSIGYESVSGISALRRDIGRQHADAQPRDAGLREVPLGRGEEKLGEATTTPLGGDVEIGRASCRE